VVEEAAPSKMTCPHCGATVASIWLAGGAYHYTGGCWHVAGIRETTMEPVFSADTRGHQIRRKTA
jgi:uncharacterized protein (UPF0212 family)